jgi:hypothetical protein
VLLYDCIVEKRLEADYAPERDIYLDKIQRWTTGAEIRKAKENREALRILSFFSRYKRYGLPFSNKAWGDCSAPLIEMLDALDEAHMVFFPRQTLI